MLTDNRCIGAEDDEEEGWEDGSETSLRAIGDDDDPEPKAAPKPIRGGDKTTEEAKASSGDEEEDEENTREEVMAAGMVEDPTAETGSVSDDFGREGGGFSRETGVNPASEDLSP